MEAIENYISNLTKEKNNYKSKESNNIKYISYKNPKVKNIDKNCLFNNDNSDININYSNNNNFISNLKEYKSLEQRVLMLEKELINQQNLSKDKSSFRSKKYYANKTQQNLNVFQNGALTEKVRPLSVKNSGNDIKFSKNGNLKRNKKIKRMKLIDDSTKNDNSYSIKNKTFTNINREKINKNFNKQKK